MNKRVAVVALFVTLTVIGSSYLLGLATGFLVFGPASPFSWSGARHSRHSEFIGRPAPSIEGLTLAEEPWSLADQRGSVVLVDFMASWCGPCLEAYPILKSIRDDYAGEVVLVSISLDTDGAALSKHIAEQGLTWPVLFEDGAGWNNSVARGYGIEGIPSLWVVDQQGNIAAVNSSEAEIIQTIDVLLSRVAPVEMIGTPTS